MMFANLISQHRRGASGSNASEPPEMEKVDESHGLLRDVLAELDRERTTRLDLEVKLRRLETVVSPPFPADSLPSDDASKDESREDSVIGDALISTANNCDRPQSAAHQDDSSKTNESVPVDQSEANAVIASVFDEADEMRRQFQVHAEKIRQEATAEADRKSKFELLAVQTERNGLAEMLEALTSENNAVSVALLTAEQGKSTTLPLHVVRLLETIPWDPKARENAIAVDEIFEWQVFDEKSGAWSDNHCHFPNQFKSLPILKPSPTRPKEFLGADGIKRGIFGRESPPNECVLTNTACTHILDIDDGYPLPTSGEWQWIGGWRVFEGAQSDQDGWTYASRLLHLISGDIKECNYSPGTRQAQDTSKCVPARKYRRRRWTRRRVLVSYPSVSEKTKHYLSLAAQNASLSLSVSKLTDQLLEMRQKLTEMEEQLEAAKRNMDAPESSTEKSRGIDPNPQPDLGNIGNIEPLKALTKLGNLVSTRRKEFRFESPASSVHDATDGVGRFVDAPLNVAKNNVDFDRSEPFNWRKIGRGALMDKFDMLRNGQKARGSDTSSNLSEDETVGNEEPAPNILGDSLHSASAHGTTEGSATVEKNNSADECPICLVPKTDKGKTMGLVPLVVLPLDFERLDE